eukprot:c19385_g1_i1.p2 GENE.c19385_g1_i1~~c19385_g1_i1.p2  ORF type:complete len:669 (-),score=135.64 c19385_g1_i1:735-2741(-)
MSYTGYEYEYSDEVLPPPKIDPATSKASASKSKASAATKHVAVELQEKPDAVAVAPPATRASAYQIDQCRKPVDVVFEDIRYSTINTYTKQPMNILNGVSGRIPAGSMVAVLGPSGAGKTTFLKVLGGRIIATSGRVSIGGKPISSSMKRDIGFVLQEDHLFSELTVRETLEFAALMRLPREMPQAEKIARVGALINAFHLSKCANTRVGGMSFAGFTPGISGGEKKRTSIANEFLFDPSLLMLDEPSSGLDSSTAHTIAAELKSLTATGRTVITTIHQPSSAIFAMFDLVLVLDAGRIAYFGPVTSVVAHFTAIGLTPPVHYNPADFMLDLTLTPEMRGDVVLADAYDARRLEVDPGFATLAKSAAAPAALPAAAAGGDVAERKFETSFMTQLWLLSKRAFKQQKGDTWSTINIVQYSVLTIVLSLIWWQTPVDAQSVNDRVGILFFLLLYFSFDPIFHTLMLFPSERPIFLKERASGLYRLSACYLAKSGCEIPISLTFPLCIMVVVYWTTGLAVAADKFFIYILILVLQVLTAQSVGLLASAAIPNIKRAMVTCGLTILTFTLLGGFYKNGKNIAIWLKWARYVSIITYANQALIQNEFRGVTLKCKGGSSEGSPYLHCPVTPQMIFDFYDITISMWGCIGIMVAIAVVLRFLAYLFLRYNRSQL